MIIYFRKLLYEINIIKIWSRNYFICNFSRFKSFYLSYRLWKIYLGLSPFLWKLIRIWWIYLSNNLEITIFSKTIFNKELTTYCCPIQYFKVNKIHYFSTWILYNLISDKRITCNYYFLLWSYLWEIWFRSNTDL